MKDVEKRIGFNGLLAIGTLVVLYGISRLFPSSWWVYTCDFSGILVAACVSLVVSALWLVIYWFLDRLQHEKFSDVIATFLYSVAACIALCISAGWITGGMNEASLMTALLPAFAFYVVFVTYIINKDSFDELVDSFIYGGFSGTGIAFALCMMDFSTFETMSLRFMLTELVTRVSVYAASCSFAGFVLHQVVMKKRYLGELIPVGILVLLLSAEAWVEGQLNRNLAWSSLDLMPLLVSLIFVVFIVSVVVFLIHRMLCKEEKTRASASMGRATSSKPVLLFFSLFVMIFAVSVRWMNHRTVRFDGGEYSFALPKGFERKSLSSGTSIFSFSNQKEELFYENSPMKLYVNYGTYELEDMSGELAFSPVHGWKVFEQKNQYIDSETKVVSFQYTYKLEKNGRMVIVDMYSPLQDVSSAQNIIRVFSRSLEEKK